MRCTVFDESNHNAWIDIELTCHTCIMQACIHLLIAKWIRNEVPTKMWWSVYTYRLISYETYHFHWLTTRCITFFKTESFHFNLTVIFCIMIIHLPTQHDRSSRGRQLDQVVLACCTILCSPPWSTGICCTEFNLRPGEMVTSSWHKWLIAVVLLAFSLGYCSSSHPLYIDDEAMTVQQHWHLCL